MKKTRILALPAIAAASLLVLTGCFQLPPTGGNTEPDGNEGDGGTSQAPEGDGNEEPAGDELADSNWTGGELGASGGTFATMEFTLNSDGTIDITDWNDGGGPFDEPGDVWSGDSSNLSMTITALGEQGSDERFDVTFTGTAEGGEMNLTGDGPDGEWTLTATQG